MKFQILFSMKNKITTDFSVTELAQRVVKVRMFLHKDDKNSLYYRIIWTYVVALEASLTVVYIETL